MADLDQTFVKLTTSLRKHGANMEQSLLNEKKTVGELMTDRTTEAPKFDDDDAIKQGYDRSKIEQAYTKTLTEPGPGNGANVAVACVLQSDWVAGAERDYRQQHKMTRVRSLCHAATRRHAQGDAENGVVTRGLVDHPKRYLQITG